MTICSMNGWGEINNNKFVVITPMVITKWEILEEVRKLRKRRKRISDDDESTEEEGEKYAEEAPYVK